MKALRRIMCMAIPLLATAGLSAASPPASRYQHALDAAAVRQDSLASLYDHSLLLGNGDLNGLLYAEGKSLRIRITKNDVWDARVDTSKDPPLMTVSVTNHTWSGGGSPPSYNHPYPCPLTCAILAIGADASWRNIRAQGSLNTWESRDGMAVMSVAGAAGASCGWQSEAPIGRTFTNLHLRLSGSTNARHFVDIMDARGVNILHSGWLDTATVPTDVRFAIPAGEIPARIILYTWTTDGALAENRYERVAFEGPQGDYAYALNDLDTTVSSTLDLRRAVATVDGSGGDSATTVRTLAQRNVFLVESDEPVSLLPTSAGFVPAPESGKSNGVDYLVQQLPADPGYPDTGDWPGMLFAVARAGAGRRTAVSVVTSLESTNVLADAIALVQSTLAEETSDLVGDHEEMWRRFWAASCLDLADTYLRDTWYRNLYFMRCVSKAGVAPVGLFAGLVSDYAAWHGDYHLNYNSDQTFWGWYACNHPELSEPYERLIENYQLRAHWFARQTYDCDGTYYGISLFLHEPPDPLISRSANARMVAFNPYSYTLGMTGWTVHNHWLHYVYYPDRELLETKVYPVVKGAARFYADFVEKCAINPATGRAVLGPSYSPEHWDFGRDDGTCDIAFARFCLKAAIKAAVTLGTDATSAARWQATLEKLPDYPQSGGSPPVIVDIAGAPPTTYNVAVPVLPVFPAGEITWFSPPAEKEIFTRTVENVSWNGNNAMVMIAVARARLSVSNTLEWVKSEFMKRQRPNGTLAISPAGGGFNNLGHFTEDFAAAGVVVELLLQSVQGIIRLFPAWPPARDAAFENLRARGGFLVSAELIGGQVREVRVRSTVGGRLQFVNPFPGKPAARTNGIAAVLRDEGDNIYSLGTSADDDVLLTRSGGVLMVD